ncbi:MAG: glycosyltransferase family 39 protein [Desulfatibacillum sp.]|nr:glycosyltransferase family 39 protein [Desulfatibacillum sp.]
MIRTQNAPHSTVMILAALAAIALCLRMFYAWDLPLNLDEIGHAQVISGFHTPDGQWRLPLGSRLTSHPLLADYITALALGLSMGSIFFARMVFILISMAGLAGIFVLTRHLFGTRAGLFALALAALDRCMAAWSPLMVEQAGFFAVPWMLFFFHRAVEQNHARSYAYLGAVSGVAYMFYEPVMLVVLPMAIYGIMFGHLKKILRHPMAWAGLACFFVIISPHLIYNWSTQWTNFKRHEALASGLGISPRVILLFLGDILMSWPDPYRVALEHGNVYFSPFRVTCSYLAGAIYLLGIAWSLSHIKDRRYALLLLGFFAIALAVTVISSHEAWNNFWWASPCLILSIILTGSLSDKLAFRFSSGRVMAATVLLVALPTLVFLKGDKHGYVSFNPEIRLAGQMAIARTQFPGIAGYAMESSGSAFQVAEDFVKSHPRSSLGQYFMAEALAIDPEKSRRYIRQARLLDPDNPLALNYEADQAMDSGEWERALHALGRAVDAGYDCYVFRKKMALSAYRTGRLVEGENHALAAMAQKADSREMLAVLFLIYKQMGREQQAEQYLESYIAASFTQRWMGYQAIARVLDEEGKHEQARVYHEKAEALYP